MGGGQIYSSSHQGAPPYNETKTMIPKQARDLIDLNLNLARTTEFETQAERYLHAAESMFSFAMAAGMISIQSHASEMVGISLIRAQRKTNNAN